MSDEESVGGPRLTMPVAEGRDHILGDASAAVTLVEYGDFECPQCGQAYPIVAEVRRALGPRLRYVFRHFPLTNVHPHAQRAAETAEWAASQRPDAFWALHDAFFKDQS